MKSTILDIIARELDSCYERDRDILKKLRQEIENMDEWIPVSEKLPEYDLRVLCYSTSENRQLVMRLDKYKSWSMQGAGYNFEYITHWKPLPYPPLNN